MLSPFRCGALILGWSLLAPSMVAYASTPAQSALAVSSSVADGCRFVGLDSLNFGSYSPISGMDAVTSGRLQIVCTKNVTFRASPNTGMNNQSLRGPGGASLSYGLYRDAARSAPWGAPPTNYFVTGSAPYCRSNLISSGLSVSDLRSFVSNAGVSTFTIDYPTGNVGVGAAPGYAVFYYYGLPNASTGICAQGNKFTRLAGTPDTQPTVSSVLPTNDTPVIYVPTSFTGTPYTTTSTSVGAINELVFYGFIPGGQDALPGAYTDLVTVTLTF